MATTATIPDSMKSGTVCSDTPTNKGCSNPRLTRRGFVALKSNKETSPATSLTDATDKQAFAMDGRETAPSGKINHSNEIEKDNNLFEKNQTYHFNFQLYISLFISQFCKLYNQQRLGNTRREFQSNSYNRSTVSDDFMSCV